MTANYCVCALVAVFFISGCESVADSIALAKAKEVQAARAKELSAKHDRRDKELSAKHDQLINEFATNHDQIVARITSALREGRIDEANSDIAHYKEVAHGNLDAFAIRADVQDTVAKLATTSKDQPFVRRSLLSRLTQIEPSNTKWRTELAAVDRALDSKTGQAGQAEKKERRSRDVLIGMYKEEVLESNWGRPGKINTTITARGTSEQWVYRGGYLYFENGVLTAIQN